MHILVGRLIKMTDNGCDQALTRQVEVLLLQESLSHEALAVRTLYTTCSNLLAERPIQPNVSVLARK